MKKAVVFSFQIGEHFDMNVFSNLKNLGDDVLLLVNDIDFPKKVALYREFGTSIIQDIYRANNGNFCASRHCAVKRPIDVINDTDYKRALSLVAMKGVSADYKTYMRESVIPVIIQEKCDQISFSPKYIFTERDFRNKASWLSKKMHRGLGKDIFRENEMKKENGNILCKGILATFNHYLSNTLGYTNVEYLVSDDEKEIFENGLRAANEILGAKITKKQ